MGGTPDRSHPKGSYPEKTPVPMINWRALPFVRLFFPFAGGIAAAWWLDTSWWGLPALSALLLLLTVWWGTRRWAYRWRWCYGLLLFLLLFTLGYQRGYQYDERHRVDHLQQQWNPEQVLLVQVEETPRIRRTLQCRGRVLARRSSESDWQACSGQLLLYLVPRAEASDLRYGDQILLRAPVRAIPAARNPEAFDYRAFQRSRNVHHQCYAPSEQWERVARDRGHRGLALALGLRQQLLTQLERYLGTTEEAAVAAALLLGERGELGRELKSAYANTGATHVLAVSGLHVGFIYLGLATLLGLLRWSGPGWRGLRTLLLLLGVWAFALVTGASPSVLRAATMFSFIILGRALSRPTNIYNTLAISASLLLLYDPYLLFEVGFQLSYLAVLGIVSFQGWIYRWWIIDHPVGDYLWQLSSVSLAAQLTTVPLCVYYFHQFPLYFWLSGLVVVPAAMGVLGLGVLFFVASGIGGSIAAGVAQLLYGLLWLMNAAIYAIEQLPLAVIRGLWIGKGGMALLYLATLLLTYLFWREHRWRWRTTVALVWLLLLVVVGQSKWRSGQRQVVVYALRQHTLVDLVDGFARWRIASSDLEEADEDFAAQNYRWKLGATERASVAVGERDRTTEFGWYHRGYGQFYAHRLVLLDRLPEQRPERPLPVEVLLLRGNARLRLAELRDYFEFRHLLADGSNRARTLARWRAEAETLGLAVIDVSRRGGQIIHLAQNPSQ